MKLEKLWLGNLCASAGGDLFDRIVHHVNHRPFMRYFAKVTQKELAETPWQCGRISRRHRPMVEKPVINS